MALCVVTWMHLSELKKHWSCDVGASAQKQLRSKKSKGSYWGGGGFNAVPDRLGRSGVMTKLSYQAKGLLMDLICQYNRKNNGDLALAPKVVRPLGWSSNAVLKKARDELIDAGLLVLSRQGGRNRPSLYALTFYQIDECIDKKSGRCKHDLTPSKTPTNDFLLHGKN